MKFKYFLHNGKISACLVAYNVYTLNDDRARFYAKTSHSNFSFIHIQNSDTGLQIGLGKVPLTELRFSIINERVR